MGVNGEALQLHAVYKMLYFVLQVTQESVSVLQVTREFISGTTTFYVLSTHGRATYVSVAERGGGQIIRSFGKHDVVSAHPGSSDDYVLSIFVDCKQITAN